MDTSARHTATVKLERINIHFEVTTRPKASAKENGAGVLGPQQACCRAHECHELRPAIARVGFTFETIFIPFADGPENPFTGRTAQDLGRSSIRDNSPEVEIELNLDWLRGEDTGGWVSSHFDIVDKISPAERPGDGSAYTHKLNFELDTAAHVFNWLPDGNWLRNIEVEGSLDYVPIGLPRAGDRFGDELFLDDASRWSFSLVFVVPLVPLVP